VIAMKWKVREVTCPVCFKRFATLSERRKFCSAQCRKRFWNRVSVARRFADPKRKQKSLERLLAWKEAHKKPKEVFFDITII
jgi:protein-arginine kinase activator protein McsA